MYILHSIKGDEQRELSKGQTSQQNKYLMRVKDKVKFIILFITTFFASSSGYETRSEIICRS